MSDYRNVSLKPEAVARLRTAQAWLTGDRGSRASLSDTVTQLVEWYEVARSNPPVAASQPGPDPGQPERRYAAHGKNGCPGEDCDVCGFNAWIDKQVSDDEG